jgi:hypothetical protein
MATQRMTLGQWQEKLGDAMSIYMVPEALNLEPHEVGRLVQKGHLPLHTFRADDDRVYRMVRKRDVKIVKVTLRPTAVQYMARALHTIMQQDPGKPPRRRRGIRGIREMVQ